MESGATAGAFVLAALVYLGQFRAGRRAQAEQVSAWLALEEKPLSDRRLAGPATRLVAYLMIRNGSEQPIYAVRCWPLLKVAEPLTLSVLPPGHLHKEEAPPDMLSPVEVISSALVLDFTDAAGRRWRRTSQGRIYRPWWSWLRLYRLLERKPATLALTVPREARRA